MSQIYRVRFEDDDPKDKSSWYIVETYHWEKAGELFAQQDCEADAENTNSWLMGGRNLVIENTRSKEIHRGLFEGEAVMLFFLSKRL